MNPVGVDLVLFGLSGVQRFITESRTTTDVVNVSRIIQRLASVAARTVQQELAGLAEPFRLIYPVLESGPDPEGVTSKVADRTVLALVISNSIAWMHVRCADQGRA